MKRGYIILALALFAFLVPWPSHAVECHTVLHTSFISCEEQSSEPELNFDTHAIKRIRHALKKVTGVAVCPTPVVTHGETVPLLQMAPGCVDLKSYLRHIYPALHFW